MTLWGKRGYLIKVLSEIFSKDFIGWIRPEDDVRYFLTMGNSPVHRSLSYLQHFGKMVRDYQPSLIHLMDASTYYLMGRFASRHSSFSASLFNVSLSSTFGIVRRVLLKIPDMLIVSSTAAYNYFKQFGVPESRLCIIHWGVDTSLLRLTSDAEKRNSREELGIPIDPKVVLYCSFITPASIKELMLVYEYAKKLLKLGDFFFLFSFKWPRNRVSDLLPNDSELLSRSRFVFAQNNIHEIFKASDVLLSPFLDNRFIAAPPLTWIECMSLGIPVITTKPLGVQEVIEDRETGYLIPRFGCLISKLANVDQDELAEVGKRAHESVKRNYDIHQSVEAYWNLWTDIAEK